jgi:hypothetical protein
LTFGSGSTLDLDSKYLDLDPGPRGQEKEENEEKKPALFVVKMFLFL